jgi:iron complex transport system substrate-binding protein
LQDFCTIVGNENKAIPMAHQRAWFRNVFTEAVGSLGQCADPSAALITKGTECLAIPSDVCEESSETNGNPMDSNSKGCVDQFIDGKDYFEDKVEPMESKYWSVTYENTYKIAINLAANETYLLYQCGTEPPEDQLDGRHAAVVSVPVEEVGLLYTTMIPFIELLGARTTVSAFFGPSTYVSSPCLSELLDEEKVEQVLDPRNETLITNVPLDLPSFIGQFGEVAFETRFRISVTEEDENLAVFEWLKFYSLFYNLEEAANDIFDTVKERYECAEQNAAALTCDGVNKPVVLWGSYSSFCGGWSVAKCPNYYCEFAEACSATLLHSDGGSIQSEACGANYMTTEEFVDFGKDADYWIYTSPDFINALAQFEDDLKDFVSVKNEQVFDTEGNPGAWFEQRLAEPGTLLLDFCFDIIYQNFI